MNVELFLNNLHLVYDTEIRDDNGEIKGYRQIPELPVYRLTQVLRNSVQLIDAFGEIRNRLFEGSKSPEKYELDLMHNGHRITGRRMVLNILRIASPASQPGTGVIDSSQQKQYKQTILSFYHQMLENWLAIFL